MVKTRIRKFAVEFGIKPSEVYLIKYAPGGELLNIETFTSSSARALAEQLTNAADAADDSVPGV